jgi:thioredoxin reductase (NADPH)
MSRVIMQEPTIFVSELRLPARVGVRPRERGADQPVVVDVWVNAPRVRRASRSERLRHTVDYVRIARTVRKVVAARHYPLVESLTEAIARALLDRAGVASVRVRVRKLRCLEDAADAGVELELAREESEPRPSPIDPRTVPESGEEVVVLGGGCAGLAAMLWCWRLGHPALLVDPAPILGGQLRLVHGQMLDLPALEPMTGMELARRLWAQLREHGGRWLRAELTGIELEAGTSGCQLHLRREAARGREGWERVLFARTIILATGVRRRTLGVPGEEALLGHGILRTAAKKIDHLAGEQVMVVGGGDSACENALLLAEVGARVTLVHRGTKLSARDQLSCQVLAQDRIQVRLGSRVIQFIGDDHLEQVELEEAERAPARLPARAALVRIGWIPNSAPLPREWLDPAGYVQTDPDGRVTGTSCAFAAGDLQGRICPSVAAAFGSGSTAARAAAMELEEDTPSP